MLASLLVLSQTRGVMPGLAPIQATGKSVTIPKHYFFYKLRGDKIVEIRPEAVPGGAPGGILEQLGVQGYRL